MPQAYLVLESRGVGKPPAVVALMPSIETARARAATITGGSAHNTAVEVPNSIGSLGSKKWVLDGGSLRMLGATDQTTAPRANGVLRRAVILAARVDSALGGSWGLQSASRFAITGRWAQSWIAFVHQQASYFVAGGLTALTIDQLAELVGAAERELPTERRIAWHFWNHDTSWSTAFAAVPRRLQVAQSDGGRADFGVAADSSVPSFTVAAWAALTTTHYGNAIRAATASGAPPASS